MIRGASDEAIGQSPPLPNPQPIVVVVVVVVVVVQCILDINIYISRLPDDWRNPPIWNLDNR